jgi:hypothetical protein
MVDSVVNFLLQRLPQLIEGASFPSRVEDEVKSFQRELERINVLKSGALHTSPLTEWYRSGLLCGLVNSQCHTIT